MEKTWKSRKTEYLTRVYGRHIEAFRGHDDDRGIYCNTYGRMLAGIESLADEPDLYVRVAMNARIRQDTDSLDRILAVFEGAEAQ